MSGLSLQKTGRNSKSTVRPNGVAAQAFEPDQGRKNRIVLAQIVPPRIRRKTGVRTHDDVDPAAFFANA
jgi:hypothetical protein